MSDDAQLPRRKKLVKRAGLPRHVKDMSKEQLEATIKKKRECNAKALTIVEKMLEDHIDEDWFLDQLKFIDVGHFQDIIEERALCQSCGYPLCKNCLKSFPSQQYRISTKYNKVYDITERKNFCSNQCYKASKFVKDQLLTSPLWLRDKEEIPTFKLLSVGLQGTGVGEEVDIGQMNSLKSEFTKLNNDKFISVADYTQDSISKLSRKVGDIELEDKKNGEGFEAPVTEQTKDKSQNDRPKISWDQDVSIPENHSKKLEENKPTVINEEPICGAFHKQGDLESQKQFCSDNVNISMLQDNCEGEENLSFKKPSGKCKPQEKGNNLKESSREQERIMKNYECPVVPSSVIHIEKCLYEWFTLETMCFLFGEDKVKDLVNDKGECIKEYYKTMGKFSWDSEVQERYEALCQKLNMMELQENLHDKEERELKPLPNYDVLKNESLRMDIKIKAFYQGKTDYEVPVNVDKEADELYKPSCILPLVDIHAQNALRRRMVFDNLKRVLPDILRTFGLSSRDVSSEVRCLIGSFRLSAHNITFNPAEWNFIGLIIIKMLSIKDLRLKMLLESQLAVKYQTMLLMAFQQDGGYLERLMVWLTDIDNIMKKT